MKIQSVPGHWQVEASRINHLNNEFRKKNKHLKTDISLTPLKGFDLCKNTRENQNVKAKCI